MTRGALVAMAVLLLAPGGVARVPAARAQTSGSLAARAFVRDSVSRLRGTLAASRVVSTVLNQPAREVAPTLLPGQLAAREIRVTRISDAAAAPTRLGRNAIGWTVPLQIQARDASGATHSLLPRIEMVGGGLDWDRRLGRYVGEVRVWLEDRTSPAAGYTLEAPVALEVGGEASSYVPTRWDVARAGLPSQDVEIAVAGARPTNTIQIKVAATSSSQQAALEASTAAVAMPLTGEPMSIRPIEQSIQGWGLEEAEVTITTSPSTSDQPRDVSVTSARGTPRAQTIHIDASGQAVARVRSGAPGLDTLWVNLENRYTRFALVRHEAPWIFLLWALGGGLLGSVLRTLGRSRGRSKHPGRRGATLLVIGVLCGLLGTGLYLVGFPVLPRIATGQSGPLVAAVIAAAVAFLGRDWLGKRLGEG